MNHADIIRAMRKAGADAETITRTIEALADDAAADRRKADRDRQRKHRAAKALETHDSVTVVTRDTCDKKERSPHTPLKEKNTPPLVPLKGDSFPPKSDHVSQAVEIYHEVCVPAGLSRVQKLTGKRQAAIRRRLYDCGGLDGWRAACQRVADSPFLLGDNDRGWKADLDFLATESKFTKLMEGGYDRTDTPNRAKPAQPADRHLAAAASRRDAWLDVIDEIEGQGASGDNWQPASPASPARVFGPRGGYDGSG